MNNQPRNTDKDVHFGSATVVWCEDLKGWAAPGGRKLGTRPEAVEMAYKINQEMGR